MTFTITETRIAAFQLVLRRPIDAGEARERLERILADSAREGEIREWVDRTVLLLHGNSEGAAHQLRERIGELRQRILVAKDPLTAAVLHWAQEILPEDPEMVEVRRLIHLIQENEWETLHCTRLTQQLYEERAARALQQAAEWRSVAEATAAGRTRAAEEHRERMEQDFQQLGQAMRGLEQFAQGEVRSGQREIGRLETELAARQAMSRDYAIEIERLQARLQNLGR